MVAYSATELCSVNCNGDVHKPTRSLRKLLFDLQLWVPLNIRSTLLHLDRLFTSAVNNNQNSNSITTAASYVNGTALKCGAGRISADQRGKLGLVNVSHVGAPQFQVLFYRMFIPFNNV